MSEEDKMLLRRSRNSTATTELQRKQTENLINFEKDRVGFTISSLTESLGALKDHNRAAFKAYKAFAIAQAIGDTYRSATSAFASLAGIPFIGPVLGAAAAAAAIAVGIGRVNQIRSLQYTGYAQGGEMTVGRPAVVGENGPEVIVPKNPSVVMPNSVKERLDSMGAGRSGGPVTVNFNITTLDAKDFDSMLIDRRATITGIINDAMVRRGKVGVY
jgi:SLT domain-containing protein